MGWRVYKDNGIGIVLFFVADKYRIQGLKPLGTLIFVDKSDIDGSTIFEYEKVADREGILDFEVRNSHSIIIYGKDTPLTDRAIYVWCANEPPTTPGAFTQPTGTLETGDSKVVSWGASTDIDNDLSKYILEVSINGGAFTQIGTPTTNTFPYTIPTATSIQFRVKAQDATGLESGYSTSGVYSVTKPKYYYARYTVASTTTYQEAPWSSPVGWTPTEFANLYRSYTFYNGSNYYGVYSQIGYSVPMSVGDVGYEMSGSTLRKYTIQVIGNEGNLSGARQQVSMQSKNPSDSTSSTSYSKDSLVQSDIPAEDGTYPTNGKHADGYWYVRGSRVSQSIAPPSPFTAPTTGKKFKPNEVASIAFGASSAQNISLYEVDYRYNETGTWTQLPYNNTLTRSLTITTDKVLKTLELRVRAKNTSNVYSDYVYSEAFVIEHNVAPTVSLTSPSENVTLYENDILNIAGTAYDADSDQAVTVYYQINSEQRKVLATNLSQTQIALSKQLTFKGGKLYDGETVITGSLVDGVAHKLKVWAEDSEKASSAIVKSFYVVPNRAPLLSVDAVVLSGVVDADKFKINGKAWDEDANSTLKVTRRINSGNSVEIYSGTGGEWEFEIALAQLQIGTNTLVVEVSDNYGAKTSKTIKLNKDAVKTPILQSVARYKIEPPKGTAKGVLLWIQRDKELDLTVELSMTLKGEQEQYVLLEANPDNNVLITDKIVEDEYYHETVEPKDNIILKLTTTRANINIDHKIYLIMGVVE